MQPGVGGIVPDRVGLDASEELSEWKGHPDKWPGQGSDGWKTYQRA